MTDPNLAPPYAKAIAVVAFVFAAVLWGPAVMQFDGEAKRWIDRGIVEVKRMSEERSGGGPPSTVPPTTLPPKPPTGERILEAQGLVDAGLRNLGAARTGLERWQREVEPLLENEAGRLIATHPQLSSQFAVRYHARRPSSEEIERLSATLRRFGESSGVALVEHLDELRTLKQRATGLAVELDQALRDIAELRARALRLGLHACLPLGRVLDDPWLVRRVCGPLPPAEPRYGANQRFW